MTTLRDQLKTATEVDMGASGAFTFGAGICALGLLAFSQGCSLEDGTRTGAAPTGGAGGMTMTGATGGRATTTGGTTTGGMGTTGSTTTGGTMMPQVSTCGGSLPATFTAICSGCHTQVGAANSRYPDLYKFQGMLVDFMKRV